MVFCYNSFFSSGLYKIALSRVAVCSIVHSISMHFFLSINSLQIEQVKMYNNNIAGKITRRLGGIIRANAYLAFADISCKFFVVK